MDGDAEKVLNVLLRSYTGLFTDYAHINESAIATKTGLTRERVYEILLIFSKRRLINYIPRKKTPFLIYTRERVDLSRLIIPKSVYEDRKENYIKRVTAILDYVKDQEHCRSMQLLRYFGEKHEQPCGICDICITSHKKRITTPQFEDVSAQVLALVKEKPYPIQELANKLEIPENLLLQTLQFMVDEGLIQQEDGIIEANQE